MSTLTLELEDETNSLLRTEARKVNFTPVEFARLAIVRALARVGKDANLERRATKSDGHGWERVRQSIPDAPPHTGDEQPPMCSERFWQQVERVRVLSPNLEPSVAAQKKPVDESVPVST